MIIPVRCFTCNQVIGHKWNDYQNNVTANINDGMTEMAARCNALDAVDIPAYKYCCRRMLLSHVDVIDQLLEYSNNPGEAVAPIVYTDNNNNMHEHQQQDPDTLVSEMASDDDVYSEDDEFAYDDNEQVGQVSSDDDNQDYTFITTKERESDNSI